MKHDINAALLPLLTITEQWFSNVLSEFAHELTDNLIAKSENTTSITIQSDCFTALHSLQHTAKEAIPVFISSITKSFQTSTANHSTNQTLSDISFSDKKKKESLNLIATKDWEENLSFDTAVEKITKQNHEEFNHLEIRTFELLKNHGEIISKNPISAENILAAFRDSMELFDFSTGIRIHVYKLFEKFLSQRISELLKKLNSEFIKEGILPEIVTDYSIKRERNKKPAQLEPEQVSQATEHQEKSYRTEQPQERVIPTSSGARRTSNKSTSSLNNRYLDLARQLSKPKVNTPPEPVPTTLEPSPQVNIGDSQSSDRSDSIEQNSSIANTNSSTLFSLKQVYENRPQTVTNYVNEHTTTTQELVDALAKIQYNISPEKAHLKTPSISVTEQIKKNILTPTHKTPETTQLKNNKLYLIDMIEDLFTHIAENKKISSSAQELFRRLMIPIIHLALIDDTFIDNEKHPARLFLEDFADASLGITDSTESKNTPIYLKLKKITHQLGNENKINSSVFSELNQDLKRFISERKQHANEKRLSPNIAVSKKIDAIIEHCIQSEDLPKGLIVFLKKIWKNVMLKVYLDDKNNSETRGRTSAFISSLIFSIKPVKTAIEKNKLERLIPIINNELSEGIELIECPEPIKEKITLYIKKLQNSALAITPQTAINNSLISEEDKIIFRNELFDDTQFSQNNNEAIDRLNVEAESVPEDLILFDIPINNEPMTKIVSSLEEAFIEQTHSSLEAAEENNKKSDNTSADKITETSNFSISKLIINKPVSNKPEKESKTDFELIRLVNNSYKMTLIDDEYTTNAKNIIEDSWLEFRFKSHYSRAKVTWIEEDKSQFNCLTQNNRIIEMSLEALSDSFRQGICSMVQSSSIIDEAIQAVSQTTTLQPNN